MSYTPTTWVDGVTPVNAENLNNLEFGVQANSEAIDEINTARENGEFNGKDGITPSITVTNGKELDGRGNVTIEVKYTYEDGIVNRQIATVVDGKDGDMPVKGVDYFTDEDKNDLVQMVITALGGKPVFGYVDENNNIFVQGNLANGNYHVKYELEDGSTVDIGDLVLDHNVYYSVTSNLTNCTISNSVTQVAEGSSYFASITADDGYALGSVNVTMGGSAVAVPNGVIDIASVTGNIVITAVANEVVTPEPTDSNLLLIATDKDGNTIINGYKTDTRLGSSDGGERTQAGACMSGFMRVSPWKTVKIENVTLSGSSGYNTICFYGENIATAAKNDYLMSKTLDSTLVGSDGALYIYTNDYSNWDRYAYFRFSCGTISADTVVTVLDGQVKP